MTAKVDKHVFPGDVLKDMKSSRSVTIIGPGLRRNEDDPNILSVTQFGTLRFKTPNMYWVESDAKKYTPRKNDLVVGVVTKRGGDTLKVDIGTSENASLSLLAFEGATKKIKPDVQPGDVVYARLLSAHREMEPELVCMDSYYKAGRLGALSNDGMLFDFSISVVHRLLRADNPLLVTLGKKYVFEIAIGLNGKVWIHCQNINHLFNIVEALRLAEKCTDMHITEVCRQIK